MAAAKLYFAFLFYWSVGLFSSKAIETVTSDNLGKIKLNSHVLSYDLVFKNEKGNYGDKDKDYEFFYINQHKIKIGQQQKGFSSKISSNPQFGYDDEYSFYSPSVKGGFQFPSDSAPSGISSMTTNKIKDIKENNDGYFSSLLLEKPSAAAAILPLSILLAAIVPGLMNYVSSDLNQQMRPIETTVINKREIRDINGTLDEIHEKLVEFANSTQSEENFQNHVCNIIAGEIPFPRSEYIEMASSIIARLIKDDWFNNIDPNFLLVYLKKYNCNDISNYAEKTTINNRDESSFYTKNLLNLTTENLLNLTTENLLNLTTENVLSQDSYTSGNFSRLEEANFTNYLENFSGKFFP